MLLFAVPIDEFIQVFKVKDNRFFLHLGYEL